MNRRERKKEETRTNIIGCAIDLFQEKGYQETSMEEIAEKVDVSKATLYNYFQDKGSILIAYFQSKIADFGQEIKSTLQENQPLKVRLGNLLDFKNHIFGDDMELTANYFRYRLQSLLDSNPFDNPQRSGLEHVVLEIITAAQTNREIRSDIPALVITRNFLLLTANYFLSSAYTKDPAEKENLKNQLIEIFLSGARL
jgi:AcrR family transcriptional regulator